MPMIRLFLPLLLTLCLHSYAQCDSISQRSKPLKISHAEPVYIDLIRDLGARKGEKELNVGWQLSDEGRYIEQGGYVEYEFAPLHRLGLEIEVPFTYAYIPRDLTVSDLPHTRIEALKLATQYTFLVSEKYRLSAAAGAIYELSMHSFHTISQSHRGFKGQGLSPFLVVAKRWAKHWHSLIYTGPEFHTGFGETAHKPGYQLNLSAHYQLPAQGHLLGIELNEEFADGQTELTLRPQVRLKLGKALSLGLVTGIPCKRSQHGLSFFTRLVYEFNAG
jgi:hypothetical protein